MTHPSGDTDRRELLVAAAEHAVPLVFLVLIVATFIEPSLAGDDGNDALRELDGWWLMAGITGVGALVFRRSHPLPAALIVVAAVTVVAVAPYDLAPVAWMVYVAAFSLGRYDGGRQALVALAAMIISVALTVPSDQGLTTTDVGAVFTFIVLTWFAGREVGRWHQRAYLEADLAARRLELERQATQLRVTEERLHIAHELHDVMAHSVGAIAVQAGMAEAAFDARPEEARRAIANILNTSRGSLGEIRRILGVLRQDPERVRAPSINDLSGLLRDVEASGLRIESEIEVSATVPASTGLAVYRIVQQALSNVLQHSGAERAWVTVVEHADSVHVEVVDNGSGGEPPSSSTGYGLVGMRERAIAHGGEFSAGPAPPGGFRVAATIPFGRGTTNGTSK